MRCELVIFDCDGVLVDSEPILSRAHAAVMAACGCPIDEAELLERFCGVADSEMIRAIERERGKPLPSDYPQRVAARIGRDYRTALQPIAGIAELLDGLDAPFCVASSAMPSQLRLALEITGLLHRFGARVYSAAMVRRGKPAPDLFLYAAEQMGAEPEATIVVEDSFAGVDAAIAARMTAIGFSGGSHCRPWHGARLISRGAAAAAESALALAAALRRLGDVDRAKDRRDGCAMRCLPAKS
jgi:HAD superfamily hydrolase (TIGR01509 family)